MNLQSYQSVLEAANELAAQGEALILNKEGRSFALTVTWVSSTPELRLFELGHGQRCKELGLMTEETFGSGDFQGCEVMPRLLPLLSKGDEHEREVARTWS